MRRLSSPLYRARRKRGLRAEIPATAVHRSGLRWNVATYFVLMRHATGFDCILRSLVVRSLVEMHALMYLFTATVPLERLPPRPRLDHPVRRSRTGARPPRIYTPTRPAFVIAKHRSKHIMRDMPSEPRARGCDHHRLDSLRSAGRWVSPPRHASISETHRVTRISRASAINGACAWVPIIIILLSPRPRTGHMPPLDARAASHVVPACCG